MPVCRPNDSDGFPAIRVPALGVRALSAACVLITLLATAGCDELAGSAGDLDAIWGRRGISDGRFQKPRAMAIDAADHIYVVDKTARIQVFDSEGNFLRGWRTPEWENGMSSGLSINRRGRLLVADTHYYRVLIYSPDGTLEQTLGGTLGNQPGEFGLVTDVVEDSQGNLYVGEYGEYDRIQKFSPAGEFILQWGGHGSEPGQFRRPQNMIIDAQDRIWVADSCNHRIQVFDTAGNLLQIWGTQGRQPGQLRYPYDLALDAEGNLLVCEFGNDRVQKFTPDGQSLGCWGRSGHKEGELFQPWALVIDSQGRIHVLDTNNHRIQRIVM